MKHTTTKQRPVKSFNHIARIIGVCLFAAPLISCGEIQNNQNPGHYSNDYSDGDGDYHINRFEFLPHEIDTCTENGSVMPANGYLTFCI